MSLQKEKVHLEAETETLLITLYAKAQDYPMGFFRDERARQILESINYDFSRLNVKAGTRLTICLRAKRLDDYLRGFLSKNPRGTVIQLGCGLGTRCSRVDYGEAQWYDLDLPEVIELRKKFFEESGNYHMIASSVMDFEWMEAIAPRDQGVFVVAEGLLMYLGEANVKALLDQLRERFPGCELAFDAFSKLAARSIKHNPLIQKTGAVITWGIDDPHEIESWGEGFRLKEEWYFIQAEEIKLLSSGNRLVFRLSGLFKTANKAHRVLYYKLGKRDKRIGDSEQ